MMVLASIRPQGMVSLQEKMEFLIRVGKQMLEKENNH